MVETGMKQPSGQKAQSALTEDIVGVIRRAQAEQPNKKEVRMGTSTENKQTRSQGWVPWRNALASERATEGYLITGWTVTLIILSGYVYAVMQSPMIGFFFPAPIILLVILWNNLNRKIKRVRSRVLTGQCLHCGGTMTTEQSWTCGYCLVTNPKPDRWTFLGKCQHCGFSPKAMECIHCNEPIFLDRDMDASHCAYAPDSARPKPRVRKEDKTEHERELENIRNLTTLYTEEARKAEAKRMKQAAERKCDLEAEKKLPGFERIAKQIEEDLKSYLGVEEILSQHERAALQIVDLQERKRWLDVIRYLRVKYTR